MKKKEKYEAPQTEVTKVELENGFMAASTFEEGSKNQEGLRTEEHGFADPSKDWEGDYNDQGWD